MTNIEEKTTMKNITLTTSPIIGNGDFRITDEEGRETIYIIPDGEYYEATAEDDEGNEYTVVWKITDEFTEAFESAREAAAEGDFSLQDDLDESDACDWNNPRIIVDSEIKDVTGIVKLG